MVFSYLAARLLFTERHTWSIWNQDDNEAFSIAAVSSRADAARVKSRSSTHEKKSTWTSDSSTVGDVYDTSMTSSLADDDLLLVNKIQHRLDTSEQVTFLHPTFGFLSRAHLTCGVAPGIAASQTGLDLLDMIRQESESIREHRSLVQYSDERTVMKYFGNGHGMIYLKEPIPIRTIFSGFFH
jgi:hypothetical protein